MSENKTARLKYDVQRIDVLKKLNDEFLLVKIYAMATGKNRNFTYISKEDVIKAIPSAYYCPVVGHIKVYVDPDGVEHSFMGGHDFEITDDWQIKDVTRPYGVIIEGSDGWETLDEHGTDVEYLTLNAFMWVGRYPELEETFYSENVLFNQSMEINIENYRPLEEDSNYWEILGFTFSAFCLLGKADEDSTNGHTDKEREHTEPAFISASVVPYEFGLDEFKQEFSLLKDKISEYVNKSISNECSVDDSAEEVTVNGNDGGESMAEENVNTAVTNEDGASAEAEIVEDVVDVATEGDFEATVEEDVADTTEEGTTEEETVEDTPDYEAMYKDAQTAYEEIKAEFEGYKASHAYDNEAYDALAQYKADRERADRETAETELFSSFEERIGETDEYKKLQETSAQYSLEDLELRLYAIVGRYSKNVHNDGKKQEVMKFSLGDVDDRLTKEDPYGNARDYYLS